LCLPGLPHTHILLWLKPDWKPKTPEAVNRFVSAEIPDKQKNPKLHELVVNQMLHGPCGDIDKKCPCMKDNLCSKNFPKDFRDITSIPEYGYSMYR